MDEAFKTLLLDIADRLRRRAKHIPPYESDPVYEGASVALDEVADVLVDAAEDRETYPPRTNK